VKNGTVDLAEVVTIIIAINLVAIILTLNVKIVKKNFKKLLKNNNYKKYFWSVETSYLVITNKKFGIIKNNYLH